MKWKNRCVVAIRDQGSCAITKITNHDYEEQNYTSSNTKTQQFIIPLLDDTSNKNNKNVLIV